MEIKFYPQKIFERIDSLRVKFFCFNYWLVIYQG